MTLSSTRRRSPLLGAAVLFFLASSPAAVHAAAWTVPQGDLVLTLTSLGDLYDAEFRNSPVKALLDEAGGSKVQTGRVERVGMFVSGEYGLADRLTVGVALAGMYTQHARVGDNLARWTNAEPNELVSLQDIQFLARYNAYRSESANPVAISPTLVFMTPLTDYDTSVHNTVGDGVSALELGVSLSQVFPKLGIFYNVDVSYRLREKNQFRVGTVFPTQTLATNPTLTEAGFKAGGDVHDQIYLQVETGYFITSSLALRVFAKLQDTLGGEDLTFSGMPTMLAMQVPPIPMFDNAVAYEQDALFVGGGPAWQITDSVSVGGTYVHAVWFRNFPNIKTVNLSLSVRFGKPEEAAPAADEKGAELEEIN